jgi:hypothetical protein
LAVIEREDVSLLRCAILTQLHALLTFDMNHSYQNLEASNIDSAQLEHDVQAALFIFNGITPGKDHLSRVASCFECSSIPKSTFISEEGCQVGSLSLSFS